MPESNTTPADVRRYVETDLTDDEIRGYITDAEGEALTYNELYQFEDGELDRLVKFYSALLIAQRSDSEGGEVKQAKQGSRMVTLTTPGENGRGWLRTRINANDPSGSVLTGRRGTKHVSFSGKQGYLGADAYDQDIDDRGGDTSHTRRSGR